MTYPIYCDLAALDDAERVQLHSLMAEVMGRASGAERASDGWRIEFVGADADLVAQVATFAELDSRCCQFLSHTLTWPQGRGTLTLDLRGPDGSGEALSHDLEAALPAAVLAAAPTG